MAGVEMIGKDVLIEISRDEGVTWLPIVCLQDVTLSTSTEPLTTSNRCRGKFSASRPNTISYTIDGTGNIVEDWEVTEEAYQAVLELQLSGATFMWRMTDAAGTYYRSGEAWVSEDTETFPNDDFATFDFTFNGTGELVAVETT
jgi:predicted secreted protein